MLEVFLPLFAVPPPAVPFPLGVSARDIPQVFQAISSDWPPLLALFYVASHRLVTLSFE